jgi:hypothetical protein
MVASALLTAVVCAFTIVIVLPSSAPRRVIVSESANINPLPTTIGFADSDIYGLSQSDVNRQLGLMTVTNVKTVRLMIPWAGVEPFQGQLNWASVDKTINAAAAKNMSILAFINSTPTWAVAPGGLPLSGRPASPAAYGDFVGKVAQRYKGKISAYEIWNEQNAVIFYSPAPDPARYTDLLKAAYPKIKAIDPAAAVVVGGLGAVIDFGSVTINPVRFVTEMYAAGAKNYFDALAFHPYNYTLKFSDGMTVANSPVGQVIQMRQVMTTNGDDGKKIWITEYGEPTSAIDEAGQATYLKDMYTKWQELPYAGPLLLYTTRDRLTGSTKADDTFGLFRSDWTAKPAQQALQFAIPAGPPKSAEFKRFSTVTDPAHGSVLSPVFRATATVWAQLRTVNALYETSTGFVTSPRPVFDIALPRKAIPTTQFVNGAQDFDGSTDFRVWWSQATGAHWCSAGLAKYWVSELGLGTVNERSANGGTQCDFEHGYILWKPWVGTKVYFT